MNEFTKPPKSLWRKFVEWGIVPLVMGLILAALLAYIEHDQADSAPVRPQSVDVGHDARSVSAKPHATAASRPHPIRT